MQKYKIIVEELILEKIKQKSRTITKKRFIKIKEVKDIPLEDASKKALELKKHYRDFKYIVTIHKQ